MDSSTSSTTTATIGNETNGQRQESPMSVQDQPIINGTIESSTATLTVPANEEVATTILTPEQEEERKLRLKYPNPQKPGGSTFIQKMLHKGCKKYFDSGDYNMAKSRTKAHLNSNGANGTTTQAPMPNSGRLVAPQRISEEVSTPNTSTNCSPNVSSTQSQNSTRLSTSPQTTSFTSSLNSSTAVQPSSSPQVDISTPSTCSNSSTLSNHHYHHGHLQTYNQQTPSLHSRLSSSNIANSSPLVLFPSGSSGSSSSSSTTSTSTSSLHQPNNTSAAAGRQLLSSSTSASNIMGAAAVMQVDPVLLNSADEIGHGIPTPECLPQSRKHAISQSKLATPRLSTS